jgi:putative hemolysin
VQVFEPSASTNARAIRRTLAWLKDGHGVTIFPAAEVSHWRNEDRCISDCPWNESFIPLSLRSNAAVVPVYISGGNSLTFQVAGALSAPALVRTARLPLELLKKRGARVEVRIGHPIAAKQFATAKDYGEAARYVRGRVYLLGSREPIPPKRVHGEVKTEAHLKCTAARIEIATLHRMGSSVVENDRFAVYVAPGDQIPALLQEIGRLREITFRTVGEGTGRDVDLDQYDSSYMHLILWSKEAQSVAGSYRLAWTQDLGVDLYTRNLFRCSPAFFSQLGPAVELGRSFIACDFQRDYLPLLMLWQAIGRVVARRPEAPVLFGAVSISAEYSQAARELIVSFLRTHCFREDLTPFVSPRRPFKTRSLRPAELRAVVECMREPEDLPISDVAEQSGIPVLLRHYLRLGGKVAAFNIDPQFSEALDALLILDLRETPAPLLKRYMGAQAASEFLSKAPRP